MIINQVTLSLTVFYAVDVDYSVKDDMLYIGELGGNLYVTPTESLKIQKVALPDVEHNREGYVDFPSNVQYVETVDGK